MLPAAVGPRVLNRPHSITADVEIPAAGAEGVLLCQGANNGGFVFYVKDQRLHYAHNYLSRAIYQVSSPDPLPEGRHRLRFEFEPTGEPDFPNGRGAPGRAQLYVDDQLVAQTDIPVTVPIAFNPGGLSCGANPGAPIVTDYRSPFRFTGTLHRVTVDVERRAHHRQRSGDANGDVPAVGGPGPAGGGCNCDLSRRRAASRVRCRRAGGAPTTTPVR